MFEGPIFLSSGLMNTQESARYFRELTETDMIISDVGHEETG